MRQSISARIANHPVPKPGQSGGVVSARTWLRDVRQGDYGGWYRYVDRPTVVEDVGGTIQVRALSGRAPTILFEFLRPKSEDMFGEVVPEKAVVISGLVGTVPEFTSLNEFVAVLDIARWASAQGAEWSNQHVHASIQPDARTVLIRENAVSFDARGLAEIQLEDLDARSKHALDALSASDRDEAEPVIAVIVADARRDLLEPEARSRGYRGSVLKAIMKGGPAFPGLASNPTIVATVRKYVNADRWSSYESDQARCKKTRASDVCDGRADEALVGMIEESVPWGKRVVDGFNEDPH